MAIQLSILNVFYSTSYQNTYFQVFTKFKLISLLDEPYLHISLYWNIVLILLFMLHSTLSFEEFRNTYMTFTTTVIQLIISNLKIAADITNFDMACLNINKFRKQYASVKRLNSSVIFYYQTSSLLCCFTVCPLSLSAA